MCERVQHHPSAGGQPQNSAHERHQYVALIEYKIIVIILTFHRENILSNTYALYTILYQGTFEADDRAYSERNRTNNLRAFNLAQGSESLSLRHSFKEEVITLYGILGMPPVYLKSDGFATDRGDDISSKSKMSDSHAFSSSRLSRICAEGTRCENPACYGAPVF